MLLAAFTIYITGMATHIGDDSIAGKDLKHGAAFVVADHHTPVILLAGSQMIPAESGIVTIDLQDGDHITLEGGVTAGKAEASIRFQQFVPSLAEPFTNMLMHEDPKKLAKHSKTIFLTYPKGDLDIALFHKEQAEFYREGSKVRTQCVPALTEFTASATGNVTLRVKRAKGDVVRTLEPDAAILIRNDVPSNHTPTPDELEKHFTKYAGVLKKRNIFTPARIATVKAIATPCDQTPVATSATFVVIPGWEPKIADQPECTNTDWP